MTDPQPPIVRTLAVLELISERPGIGAAELASRLGVSERAVRRHVELLRGAGVGIEARRGRYGGYWPERGARMPVRFTAAEAISVVMAVLDGHHRAGDPDDPVGAALGKILRTLPPSVALPAEALRRTTEPVPNDEAARARPEVAAALIDAVDARRRLDLHYVGESGRPWEVTVDPWAVVVRHARWYLLCFAHQAGAVRTLRVDRIQRVDAREESFEPPEQLDAVAVLEANLATGWEHDVEIWIDAPVAEVARWLPRALGSLTPDGGGCLLRGTTSDPAWYVEQLTRLPCHFVIRADDAMRAAAAELGERLLAASRDSDH
ncbi:YafY family protein [Blastococcus sp. Marseille-P5729]|uniref:helix-turn-helix transcriptional regulator n=1 Tax=Blastococcus sp. Marseille-P5729 TaxID=2086582 RepID=UPI000D0FC384|nr:WYL domain-containing protein [Blastococcus sp. Marseille-P5729]